MDPQASVWVNPNEQGTQDSFVDLYGNVFETQIELGLISELKSLVKIIPIVISQSNVELAKNYNIKPSFIFPKFIHWSASNYVIESWIVMSSNASRVVCGENSQNIR